MLHKFLLTGVCLALCGQFPSCVWGASLFEVFDSVEFAKIISTNESLKTLSTGMGWIEGPAWVPANGTNEGYLVFSDQSNNKMYKWSPSGGRTIFRAPSNNLNYNGNTLDLNDQLISCQSGGDGRAVVAADKNGVLRVLVNRYNSKTLNAPNDVVVKSDGSVWFSDPNYGSGQTQPGRYLFQFTPPEGNQTIRLVSSTFVQPNGLAFSPDESLLYVADSDSTRHHIKVFKVSPTNTLTSERVFCTLTNGVPDGIRCDALGHVWSSAGDGIEIFNANGRMIGKIRLPNTAANLCFGDADGKTVYIVAQPNLYSLRVLVQGATSMRKLKVSRAQDTIQITWPAPSAGLVLEQSDRLDALGKWQPAGYVPVLQSGLNVVTIKTDVNRCFFRLNQS